MPLFGYEVHPPHPRKNAFYKNGQYSIQKQPFLYRVLTIIKTSEINYKGELILRLLDIPCNILFELLNVLCTTYVQIVEYFVIHLPLKSNQCLLRMDRLTPLLYVLFLQICCNLGSDLLRQNLYIYLSALQIIQ
jgi:hypothetical protein